MEGQRIRTRIFPGPQNLPLLVAEDRGVFKKHGVEAMLLITRGSDEQRTGLASGELEVIHSAVDNAVYMADVEGHDIVIVAGGSTGMNDLVVRPDVSDVAEIRGRKVVVDAATTAYAFQLYTILNMNGISAGEYGVLPAGGATQRLQAMREKPENAAAMLNPPWNFVAEEEGFRRLGSAVSYLGSYQGDGIFVRREWAAANADLLVRYLRAVIEATRWAFEPRNREHAVEILAARLGISPQIAARSIHTAIDEQGLAPDGRFDLAGFRNLLSIRRQVAATWKKEPDPHRYLDFTYREKALAGLN